MDKFLNRVTVKKVITEIGHDKAGYQCNLYLDNKKVAEVNDDGWGGEVDVNYVSEKTQAQLLEFVTENNYAEYLFNNGWKFMKDPKEICFHTQVVALTEYALNKKEEDKVLKKIERATVKGIVFGNHNESYTTTAFKITLKEIVKHPQGGVAFLQERYDKIKAKLKEGEKIYNTNLEELGIKL